MLRVMGGKLPSIVFTASAYDTNNRSTYTFSAQALGAAASDRLIIVGVGNSDIFDDVSAVTVAGISATKVVQAAASNQVSLWQAAVPTGTTGNVVVSVSGGGITLAIHVWAAYGLRSTTAHDTAGASSGAVASLAIPARGVAVGILRTVNPYTWAGLSEDAATAMGSTDFAGASVAATAATTSAITNEDDNRRCGASWR